MDLDTAGRLNEARRLSAELAVKDDRLRFAADLHDIQGHHLQVIALKSELAARLAEVDPVRAAAEMNEVRRLSADALRDTRAVVHGYRRTTLDEELANATRVLASAGIDTRMTLEPGASAARLATPARHLLGTKKIEVGAGGRETMAWDTNQAHGWYDLVVTVAEDEAFRRRLLGHLENGRPSVSG